MEKFSAFRDPPTGIAPFVVPVPPSASTPKAVYPLYPLLAVLSLARTLLVSLTLLLAWLISSLLLPLVCVPLFLNAYFFWLTWLLIQNWTHLAKVYDTIDRAQTAVLLRLALAFLGYPWISLELSSLKRGFASASKSMELPLKPFQGDLITANWSSYIDVLYLAFRCGSLFYVSGDGSEADHGCGIDTIPCLSCRWSTKTTPSSASLLSAGFTCSATRLTSRPSSTRLRKSQAGCKIS